MGVESEDENRLRARAGREGGAGAIMAMRPSKGKPYIFWA